MTTISLQELVALYDLQPHPEGGYFRETYRDKRVIESSALPPQFGGNRNISTAIYFLLPAGKKSHLHRIKSDEVWHFYLGGPLTLVEIAPHGEVTKIVLGHEITNGHVLQHVVPAGSWFGAYPNAGSHFSFVGCTVAPGFDFADFEMGRREDLMKQFSHAHETIELLT
jgi:uncharacterized protein